MHNYKSGTKSTAFDCSEWHPDLNCIVTVVTGYGGQLVKLWCGTCRVLADIEAVSRRIDCMDSCKSAEQVKNRANTH